MNSGTGCFAAEREILLADSSKQCTVQHWPEHDDRRMREQVTDARQIGAAHGAPMPAAHRPALDTTPVMHRRVGDPESLKRRDGIRCEQQRKTQLARVRRTLEDANAPAGTLQCDARSEPS